MGRPAWPPRSVPSRPPPPPVLQRASADWLLNMSNGNFRRLADRFSFAGLYPGMGPSAAINAVVGYVFFSRHSDSVDWFPGKDPTQPTEPQTAEPRKRLLEGENIEHPERLSFFLRGLLNANDGTELRCSVLIDMIPPSAAAHEVMSLVDGGPEPDGQVYSYDRVNMRVRWPGCTHYHAILVRFMTEEGAAHFFRVSRSKPLVVHGKKCRVAWIPTPTMGLTLGKLHNFTINRQSRSICIREAPDDVSAMVLLNRMRPHGMGPAVEHQVVESIRLYRHLNMVDLVFTSVPEAVRNTGRTTSQGKFVLCKVYYGPDPSCREPQRPSYVHHHGTSLAMPRPAAWPTHQQATPAQVIDDEERLLDI
ncbi:hypothetical protein BDY21DRAFT_345811 [Lineolata rhizophorae]|uniref:RRM domain-containing protein n=1 Tax=Lineolata rhizophorae TaxID=578093 RepID=A0A6A6NYU6_9PEZI|nr:hypothetical protein BDY21DRAFT_345811 [Lineolata rhizophorae]